MRVNTLCHAALLAAGLLLAGCAWQPAQPFWPLGGQGPADLAAVEPAGLRVAVRLPRPLQPRPGATELRLRLHDGAGGKARETVYPMVLVNEGRNVRAGRLPDSGPGYLWYLFKLTPDSETALASLQEEQRKGGESFRRQYPELEISVATGVRDAQPDQSYSLEIRLQAGDDADFERLPADRIVRRAGEASSR